MDGSTFTRSVIVAASTYPTALAHRAREPRIATLIAQEDVSGLPSKLARLALSLHCAASQVSEWDLTGRAEELMGASKRVNSAVTVFNRFLDAALPWNAAARDQSLLHLQGRQETFRRYRKQKEWLK